MGKNQTLNEILKRKVVAVLRVKEESKLQSIIESINAGGISIAEITMTVPNAIQLIERMCEKLDKNIIIGVGSVLNSKTAESAIKANTKYVVSPVFNKEIIETAHRFEVPAIPGCFSPTEIQTAFEAGADIVKVFPADIVGMEFFKAILAPMPHLKIMPTGGVSPDEANLKSWFEAGATCVGMGSQLFPKEVLAEKNYEYITKKCTEALEIIKKYRNR